MMQQKTKFLIAASLFSSLFYACAPAGPVAGPDKQSIGTFQGAATGAGSGAIIGAQLTAGAGPGAAVGAGFGAVLGALKGAGVDLLEEEDIKQLEELERLKIDSWTQEVMADHYKSRLRLYPGRDIYPADLFFEGDSSVLCPKTKILAREIGGRLRNDMPWSRIEITSYSTAKDGESSYAEKLNQKRAEEIAVQFVRAGVEPRRIGIRSMTLPAPLVVDPADSPARYRQSIEIAALDY
jgi:outer membrane protein OmpA-like peptidoglycan-associated protein